MRLKVTASSQKEWHDIRQQANTVFAPQLLHRSACNYFWPAALLLKHSGTFEAGTLSGSSDLLTGMVGFSNFKQVNEGSAYSSGGMGPRRAARVYALAQTMQLPRHL